VVLKVKVRRGRREMCSCKKRYLPGDGCSLECGNARMRE
jgi:hypothetical protein